MARDRARLTSGLRSAGAVTFAGIAVVLTPSAAYADLRVPTSDFDGDGYADVAVGAPTDSVSGFDAAGAVNVIEGRSRGLTSDGGAQFTQATGGIGIPALGDGFGNALANGDFDGDGFADLAVGVPGEDVSSGVVNAGAVHVLYGTGAGLSARGSDLWTQDSPRVPGAAAANDGFGSSLAAGDFDGDGYGDLAIGSPGDTVSGRQQAGVVHVLMGGRSGLRVRGRSLWTADTPGVKGIAGTNFRFGASLAAGDVSANGRDELAIGIPGGTISGRGRAGAVLVLYGRSNGLSSVDDLWSQDARGIKGVSERLDNLGTSLAIGDFDDDGTGDLAIGTEYEDVGSQRDAGAVNVLYGTNRGLDEDRDQLWTRDSRGIKGRAQSGDRFGSSLAAADFSRGGGDDLAIGVPGDDTGGVFASGSVNVLYGDADGGLEEIADQLLSQRSRGIKGVLGGGDVFGTSVSAGDFDGDGAFDLVIGAPGDSIEGYQQAGVINVLYGSTSGITGRDQIWSQGKPGIFGAPGNDSFGRTTAAGSAR